MDRIQVLKTHLINAPTDVFLWYALALEYMKIKELEGSKRCFENAIKCDENYLAIYYQYGKLCESMHNKMEAISFYKKGIEIALVLKDMKTYNELVLALEDLEEQ